MTASAAGTVLRRQFVLPDDDVEFLNGLGLDWETIIDNGVQWLLLIGFSIPPGYNVTRATLAIRIVPGYPAAALDMIYVNPPLRRTDGAAVRALTPCSIAGIEYQQWSRHYTAANPWRPNTDCIATHLHAAEEWFRKGAQ